MPAMSHDEIARAVQAAIGHHRAGRLQQAEAGYRQVLAMQPDHPDALHLLGVVAAQAGRLDEAIACFQRFLAVKPNVVEVHYNLALAWAAKREPDKAIACYQRALELNPKYAEAHLGQGLGWKDKGQLDQAIVCFKRALDANPKYVEAHYNLGNALRDTGHFVEAIACFQKALSCNPGFVIAYRNLGYLWRHIGQIDQAVACYRQALALKPDFVGAHDNLLYTLPFHPDSDRPGMFAEFQNWNRQHARPLRRFIQTHANDRNPNRRLRIAYVSPNFHKHPVGRFMLPLLARHDRVQFEVFCYASSPEHDELTTKLKSHADVWRSIVGLSDEQAAQLIRKDQIDILVDLSMHMADNRMLVFARKPAPVQVTYLAYAGGTAVDTIDYRLTDRYLDPDPADDRFYMEKSIRLDGTYWCYQQSIATQPVNALPALTAGTITLGCLNNFSKVSPGAMETWATLLNRLGSARLVLHTIIGSHREKVIRFMTDRGVAADRLDIVGRVSPEEYFTTYQRIDLAVDPFPYAGGTTTCDALWMGIPVVTLAGRTAVGRAGVSILSNVGLDELIAGTPQEYVRIAADLAADLPRLAQFRATLRQRMQDSALMDETRYAHGIEAAYRTMWCDWCRQPAGNSSSPL